MIDHALLLPAAAIIAGMFAGIMGSRAMASGRRRRAAPLLLSSIILFAIGSISVTWLSAGTGGAADETGVRLVVAP